MRACGLGRMWSRDVLIGLAAALVPAACACGQVVHLTFDELPAMGNSQGSPVPVAAQLRDQYLATDHVRFSSGGPFVTLVALGSNHATSAPNALGGSAAGGTLSYSPTTPVRGEFLAADGVSPLTTTYVSIEGDLMTIPGDKRLRVYDIEGNLLQELAVPDSMPGPMRIDMPGIHSFEASGDSGTVAFDDLEFSLPGGCGSADFNGDGDVGTDADIEAFFACLAGSCCATCGSADFNGDGDVGTDADIEAFFRVLGGGNC